MPAASAAGLERKTLFSSRGGWTECGSPLLLNKKPNGQPTAHIRNSEEHGAGPCTKEKSYSGAFRAASAEPYSM